MVIAKDLQPSGGDFWLLLFRCTKKQPLCAVSSVSNERTSKLPIVNKLTKSGLFIAWIIEEVTVLWDNVIILECFV